MRVARTGPPSVATAASSSGRATERVRETDGGRYGGRAGTQTPTASFLENGGWDAMVHALSEHVPTTDALTTAETLHRRAFFGVPWPCAPLTGVA